LLQAIHYVSLFYYAFIVVANNYLKIAVCLLHFFYMSLYLFISCLIILNINIAFIKKGGHNYYCYVEFLKISYEEAEHKNACADKHENCSL
jgi:hypothetical protein